MMLMWDTMLKLICLAQEAFGRSELVSFLSWEEQSNFDIFSEEIPSIVLKTF